MSQLSFDVIKRVWPKSGLVTLLKKYSRIAGAMYATSHDLFSSILTAVSSLISTSIRY